MAPLSTVGTRVIQGKLYRIRRGLAVRFTDQEPAPPSEPVRRPAHIARLLAFAYRLQAAIDRGDVQDRAHLARQLGVTRARITQLLDLTLLTPDLPEHILFLEAVHGGEPLSERSLRCDACRGLERAAVSIRRVINCPLKRTAIWSAIGFVYTKTDIKSPITAAYMFKQ